MAFIGSTLALLASQDGTWVHTLAPSWTGIEFELAAAALIAPVTMLRSFSFLSLTSESSLLCFHASLAAERLSPLFDR